MNPIRYYGCYYIQKLQKIQREVKILKVQGLAERLRNKDEKALEEIIKIYSPLAAAIIYNISKGSLTKEDIEEICSDVFVTLWKNTDKVSDEKLKGYICCIAKTRALNKLSSVRNNIISIDEYDIEDDFSITDHTETKDIHNELREIISDISEPDKEILIRYYYYCQTTSKISAAMNINQETVKTKLKRTRSKIKAILTERGYEI